MNPETFEQMVRTKMDGIPFCPFAIKLASGERLEVHERDALVSRGAVGVYFAKDGEMTIVDAENVEQIN